VWVEKLGEWRITLLPGVLLAAEHTVMLVAGADKADAVHAVFHGPYEPLKYPAQTVAHHGRRATWFLDEAAARLMD
jgi:6-phosphogluconolactonase/glucosamine-6-phosphate isomerase/deaminase